MTAQRMAKPTHSMMPFVSIRSLPDQPLCRLRDVRRGKAAVFRSCGQISNSFPHAEQVIFLPGL